MKKGNINDVLQLNVRVKQSMNKYGV